MPTNGGRQHFSKLWKDLAHHQGGAQPTAPGAKALRTIPHLSNIELHEMSNAVTKRRSRGKTGFVPTKSLTIWLWSCAAQPGRTVTVSTPDVMRKITPPANDAALRSGSEVDTPTPLRSVYSAGTCAAGTVATVTVPTNDVLPKSVASAPHSWAPQYGSRGQDKELSQFYTRSYLAKRYYRRLLKYYDSSSLQMVEPSAGWGVFLVLMPSGSFGCDIQPMGNGIYEGDFLTLEIRSNRRIACIGNPPFGTNARLAICFFNHAASFSDVIAFIVPQTFRKTATINKLDDAFHLLHEELVPDDAFIFQGKRRSVPTVFQIWVRQKDRRAKLPDVKTHPDFEFTSREKADFAIQRIGHRAGRVHDALWRSDEAHYFIKGNVKQVMKSLERAFAGVAQNTAGNPSLSMAEIVSIYSEQIAKGTRPRTM